MTIEKTLDGKTMTLTLAGRLDTTTAPQLEEEVRNLGEIEALIFDFSALEYLSSAGLRVLLAAQKTMNRQGKMTIRHANPEIKEVFDITGFSDILTVED